ncbi:MAG: hypothetical protein EBS53_00850 [Bacteroidetes bacterium]|nr:hypothetical protein [Bacteroidota bacterium]
MALLASTLPAGTKYSTPQELLNLFAQNLSIPASDSSLFVLSNTAPTDVSKVWIDTSGASPVLKVYLNGTWTSISVSSVFLNGLTVSGADVSFINNSIFVSNANQRVGIGTSSPQQKLDVSGTVRCQNLTLTSGGTLAADTITVGGSISLSGSTATASLPNINTTNLTVSSGLSIPDLSIATAKLQNQSVTTEKITDANITDIKLSTSIRADLAKASALRPGMTIPTTGKVKGIAVINGGQDYYAPIVVIDPPSEAGGITATATATVVNGVITYIAITNEGSGYTDQNPTVTIYDGGGSNAVALAYACVDPLPRDDASTSRVGDLCFYGITSNNSIKVSGYSRDSNLALGSSTNQYDAREIYLWDVSYENNNVPQPVPVKLYTSSDSLYVLASDGSLWSTGDNYTGQLGKGYTGDAAANYYLTKINLGGGVVLKFAVNAGIGANASAFCMALVQQANSRFLYGWGYNGSGAMGNGGTANVGSPTILSGVEAGADTFNTITDIVCAGRQDAPVAVVLFSSGLVRASGYNAHGQLARGTNTASTSWNYVKMDASTNLSNVVEICGHDAWYSGLYFRTSGGRLYHSGYNDGYGYAGNGTTVSTPYFVKEVSGGAVWPTGPGKFIFTSGGYKHGQVWAIRADGSIYRWGNNLYGQLGDGTTGTARTTPQLLSGYTSATVKRIMPFMIDDNDSNGWTYGATALLMSDGRIFVSGRSGYGGLGTGIAATLSTFTRVRFPKEKVKDIYWINKRTQNFSLCVLGVDGNLYTAGLNNYNMFLRGDISASTTILTQARL